MKRDRLRSIIFNIIFYASTAVGCFAYIPLLFLDRTTFLKFVRLYLRYITFLERYILGLTYVVRGREYLPAHGSFLVAAKHQSQYETFKLHLLFDDPAIVLKKELLRIPLFGQYLAKVDVIAIDRSTPDAALQSIEKGAQRVQRQGRPIIIFPQGTRVLPSESAQTKPYKVGIARMQDATNLPVIPMALNAGMFWPKRGLLKSSGTVVFEFLKPIPPGLDRATLLKTLEERLENRSQALMQEALARDAKRQDWRFGWMIPTGLIATIILCVAYTVCWFWAAHTLQDIYSDTLRPYAMRGEVFHDPVISGFPGPLQMDVPSLALGDERTLVALSGPMHFTVWPLPFLPGTLDATPVSIADPKWPEPLYFRKFTANFVITPSTIHIVDATLWHDSAAATLAGIYELHSAPAAFRDGVITIRHADDFIMHLLHKNFVDNNTALASQFILSAFSKDSVADIPILLDQQTVMIGPWKIDRAIFDPPLTAQTATPNPPAEPAAGPETPQAPAP